MNRNHGLMSDHFLHFFYQNQFILSYLTIVCAHRFQRQYVCWLVVDCWLLLLFLVDHARIISFLFAEFAGCAECTMQCVSMHSSSVHVHFHSFFFVVVHFVTSYFSLHRHTHNRRAKAETSCQMCTLQFYNYYCMFSRCCFGCSFSWITCCCCFLLF